MIREAFYVLGEALPSGDWRDSGAFEEIQEINRRRGFVPGIGSYGEIFLQLRYNYAGDSLNSPIR